MPAAVRIDKYFRKRLRKKPPQMQAAVARCIKKLTEDPKRPGLRVHEVEGAEGVWEASVDDANRVTFHYDGPTIVLRNNCNHDILSRRP